MRLMVPALFATAAVGALAVGYVIARTGFPIESYNIASSSMADAASSSWVLALILCLT